MDADWGSSSDEEESAERTRREKEKLEETMVGISLFVPAPERVPCWCPPKCDHDVCALFMVVCHTSFCRRDDTTV